jgi:mannonate dehydratase
LRSFSWELLGGGLENIPKILSIRRKLVRQKYRRLIYPEHPRALDYHRERADFKPYYPGGGGYAAYSYNVGYTRAMLQASLAT